VKDSSFWEITRFRWDAKLDREIEEDLAFLTPSCGGRAPTAERTLNPARMFSESLTSSPELENSQGHRWAIFEGGICANLACG
jgi:hypothetical protein